LLVDAKCFSFVAESSAKHVTLVVHFGVNLPSPFTNLSLSIEEKKVEVRFTEACSVDAATVGRQSSLKPKLRQSEYLQGC
jgi:hypothetical protein